MNLVIDASVLVKAYVPEFLSEDSEEVLSRVADADLLLLAPDLLYPEIGNILWKKRRLGELTPAEVEEIVDAVTCLPIRIEPSRPVMPLAVTIALNCGITVYDAMYVAVARIYETGMLTADKKLVEALANTGLAEYALWLGDGII